METEIDHITQEVRIPSYGKVAQLGHRLVQGMTSGHVAVQEKIDGSQISFMMDHDKEIKVRSKNMAVHPPGGMFEAGYRTIESMANRALLRPGWIYRGEYLNKPKHNALAYDRMPVGCIVLFDVETGPGYFFDQAAIAQEADWLGIDCAPEFFYGPYSEAVALIENFLVRPALLGGTNVEGVVIKARDKFGPDGKMLMCKVVRPEFKELHAKSWGESNPSSKDIVAQIVAEVSTEARWNKAVQHAREDGILEHDPRDIGKLLKYLQDDIQEEAADHIARRLVKHFMPQIKRAAVRGFPEWYKEQIFGVPEADSNQQATTT